MHRDTRTTCCSAGDWLSESGREAILFCASGPARRDDQEGVSNGRLVTQRDEYAALTVTSLVVYVGGTHFDDHMRNIEASLKSRTHTFEIDCR